MTDIATIRDALASAELWQIIALSLSVSLSAAAIATVLGLPCGVALAVWRFPGRHAVILTAKSLLGLPPVVVGLALYLPLSHTGPLGWLRLLFTPTAMVVAQAVPALPIVTALAHRSAEDLWAEHGDAIGASKSRAIRVLIDMARVAMLTAALAGFGRTISEVGAILIVGGNIAGYTRTMTTAVALETSKGKPFAGPRVGAGYAVAALKGTATGGHCCQGKRRLWYNCHIIRSSRLSTRLPARHSPRERSLASGISRCSRGPPRRRSRVGPLQHLDDPRCRPAGHRAKPSVASTSPSSRLTPYRPPPSSVLTVTPRERS